MNPFDSPKNNVVLNGYIAVRVEAVDGKAVQLGVELHTADGQIALRMQSVFLVVGDSIQIDDMPVTITVGSKS